MRRLLGQFPLVVRELAGIFVLEDAEIEIPIPSSSRVKGWAAQGMVWPVEPFLHPTKEEWQILWDNQNGECDFCGGMLLNKYAPKELRPVLDHHHETGFIRGILHNRCNILVDSGRGSSKQNRRMDAEIRAYKECPIVFWMYDIALNPEHLEDVLGSS